MYGPKPNEHRVEIERVMQPIYIFVLAKADHVFNSNRIGINRFRTEHWTCSSIFLLSLRTTVNINMVTPIPSKTLYISKNIIFPF